MQTTKVLQSPLWVCHSLLLMQGVFLRSFTLLLSSSCLLQTFLRPLLHPLPCLSLLQFSSLLFHSQNKRTLPRHVVLTLRRLRVHWFPLKWSLMMRKAQERWRRVSWIEWMKKQSPSSGGTTRVEQPIGEQCVLPIWSIPIPMLMPRV